MTDRPTPETDAFPTNLIERSIHEALHSKGMSTHSGKVQLDCSHVQAIIARSRNLERQRDEASEIAEARLRKVREIAEEALDGWQDWIQTSAKDAPGAYERIAALRTKLKEMK